MFQNVSPLFTLYFLPSYFNIKLGEAKEKKTDPRNLRIIKHMFARAECYCNLKPSCRLRKFCCLCLQSILNLFLSNELGTATRIIFPLNIRFFRTQACSKIQEIFSSCLVGHVQKKLTNQKQRFPRVQNKCQTCSYAKYG